MIADVDACRLVQPIPACRAKMDLLKWTEKYLRQQASDLAGKDGQYGVEFYVTIQDSWGSLETLSIEDVAVPLAGDVERIRFELVCYEQTEDPYQSGREYFRVSITFANNPAFAICQMRLTADTAAKLVHGMWAEIEERIKAYPMKGFVRRFKDGWLIAFLIGGIILSIATTLLFAFQLFSAGTVGFVASSFALLYTVCSWRLPHCVLDTGENEHRLDWNKRFWWMWLSIAVGSVLIRLALKFAFDL